MSAKISSKSKSKQALLPSSSASAEMKHQESLMQVLEKERDGIVDTVDIELADTAADDDEDDSEMLLDSTAAEAESSTAQDFAAGASHPSELFAPHKSNGKALNLGGQQRKVSIPSHRMTPLKKDWPQIYGPITESCGLQIRMNVKKRTVEIRTSKYTEDTGILQKAADFVKAYSMGFEVQDSIALLRMDDLFMETFEVKDVKTLHGDHLARAIGRIAGKDGKTKFTIENASRTRVVLAESKIHILGSFSNIRIARDAIVSLILGSPPGKVYANLRMVGSRLKQRM